MINREIIYERNVSRSYMKIAASLESPFDEKMMLKRKLPGLLPVEKCFINGVGQYWYNITGKQALDTYCKMKMIGVSFMERMIVSICNQLEILEWNLIDVNCLVLDPELIFIANGSEEIIFTIYPGSKHEIFLELQQLMEYLLTKIDHKDKEAVHSAYNLYEMTLNETYSIIDIKNAILNVRGMVQEESHETLEILKLEKDTPIGMINKPIGITNKKEQETFIKPVSEKKNLWESMMESIQNLFKKSPSELFIEKKEQIKKEEGKKEKYKDYRTEQAPVLLKEEIRRPQTNPTICLSSVEKGARGLLLYEGGGHFPDYELKEKVCNIGKDSRAELFLEKETISRFHAKIEYLDNAYYIEDLNSTNGTYINDDLLIYKQQRKLEINDIIRFADVRYRFL